MRRTVSLELTTDELDMIILWGKTYASESIGDEEDVKLTEKFQRIREEN